MRFQAILADCPWRFKNWSMADLAQRGEEWARRNGRSPYDVMDTDALCRLPVKDVAARDCVLFLWATYPKLADALRVIDAWSFEFKTVAFTWAKKNPSGNGWKFGLGYWTRGNCEVCLLATRGHPKRISNAVPQLVVEAIGRHSEKPQEVHRRVVQLLGDVPRLELFARRHVPGWVCVGNELTSRDITEDLRLLAAAEDVTALPPPARRTPEAKPEPPPAQQLTLKLPTI